MEDKLHRPNIIELSKSSSGIRYAISIKDNILDENRQILFQGTDGKDRIIYPKDLLNFPLCNVENITTQSVNK